MAKKKKKTTKKAPARKPKRSPVVAQATQEEDAATAGPKKKPKRRAVTAEDVANAKTEEKAPEEQPEEQPEEEVITAVEVELRETVYDLLAKEAQRRKLEPTECAAMLIEMSLTSIAAPAPTRAAGNLVDDDEPDDENDALLEDPDFQDSIERLVQGGA